MAIYCSFNNFASEVLPPLERGPIVTLVINWLETTKDRWLIVVDNYEMGDITTSLPRNSKGNILFTSRTTELEPRQPPKYTYSVPEMNVEEATLLLFQACGLLPSPEREPQARALVQELDFLPLAIEQAAGYVRMQRCTFEELVPKLRSEKNKLLNEAPDSTGQRGKRGVYATFELSWDSIKSLARESSDRGAHAQCALQILNTFCFYHSQNIPAELAIRARVGIEKEQCWEEIGLPEKETTAEHSSSITEGTDAAWMNPDVVLGIRRRYDDGEYTSKMFSEGLQMLFNFSLLNLTDHTRILLSINPLVQSWLRDRMLPGSFDRNLSIARSFLDHAYCKSVRDNRSEKFYPLLLPHMNKNHAYRFKRKDEPSPMESNIRWSYVQILKKVRLWDEAISSLKGAVDTFRAQLHPNHWSTLTAKVELGRSYMGAGRSLEAWEVLQEVYHRILFCPNMGQAKLCHVQVCGDLSTVALLLPNYGAAMAYSEEAVKRAKLWKVNILRSKMQLCLVYQYVEKWDDALSLADEIFNTRLRQRPNSRNHHLILKAETDLACIQARRGNVDMAEKTLARIAQQFEEEFGKDHYDTLVARTNLGWVYFLQNRLGEAEELQREVLDMGRKIIGPRDLYTLYMMLRLGLTLGESGKYTEAIALLNECREGRSAALGEDHPAECCAKLWRNEFWYRMRGLDLAEGVPNDAIENMKRVKRCGDQPYTPVLF